MSASGAWEGPALAEAPPCSNSSKTCSTGCGLPSSPTRHGWMIPCLHQQSYYYLNHAGASSPTRHSWMIPCLHQQSCVLLSECWMIPCLHQQSCVLLSECWMIPCLHQQSCVLLSECWMIPCLHQQSCVLLSECWMIPCVHQQSHHYYLNHAGATETDRWWDTPSLSGTLPPNSAINGWATEEALISE